MTTSVTITGTGCPIPDADRAGPGVLVRYDNLTLQFDAGRSTVQRLAGADVWVPDLTSVFLTHHHSDHVVGLADVALTHWVMDRDDRGQPLTVVAPNGDSSKYVASLLDGWEADIDVRTAHSKREHVPAIDLRSFDVPDVPTEVWRAGDVTVSAMQVRHEPVQGAVGYRVDTPDGAVVITGDTRVCAEVAALAEGADVVVYEAMRMDVIGQRPPDRQYIMEYHSDTRLIGKQMAELAVPKLMLTHLIPAPQSKDDEQLFIDDVREGGYEGEILVCSDLDTVVL